MKALLAALLLALPMTAQKSPTFYPFVLPGHGLDGTWSPCCGHGKLPHLWLEEVPGFPAVAGGLWGIRPSRDIWPRCDDYTYWEATYEIGPALFGPFRFPMPNCSTGLIWASMSSSPITIAYVQGVMIPYGLCAPGGTLATYVGIPSSLKGVELYVQAKIQKWGWIPQTGMVVVGQTATWVASVTVE